MKIRSILLMLVMTIAAETARSQTTCCHMSTVIDGTGTAGKTASRTF